MNASHRRRERERAMERVFARFLDWLLSNGVGIAIIAAITTLALKVAGILTTTGLYSITLRLMGRSNIPLPATPAGIQALPDGRYRQAVQHPHEKA